MELFKVELLKIKKMSVFQLAIIAPLLTIIVAMKTYGIMKPRFPRVTPWQELFTVSSILFIGMLLPMLVIYITMIMGRIENLHNGWKQLLAMPVKRDKVYIAKYLVVIFVFVVSLISYLLEYTLAAYFLGAKGMVPIQVLINMVYVFIAIQPFIILLFVVSNRSDSLVMPIGVGMILTLSSLLIVQSSYWRFAPWTYALGLIQGNLNIETQILPLLTISILLFLMIFSLDIVNFKKKDIR